MTLRYGQQPTTLPDVQAAYDQAQREYKAAMSGAGSQNNYGDTSAVDAARQRMNALAMQMNTMQGNATTADAQSQAEANKKHLYDLANSRLSDLTNDPTDKLVLQSLTDRATGKVNPYDEKTQNALMTTQAQMADQVARNQMSQLSNGGGNVNDPSYQSRLQEINAARLAATQNARLGIDTQANLANYAAQGDALGGLGSFNQAHNAAITNQNHYLSGLYQQEQFTQQNPIQIQAPQQMALPNYQQYAQFQAAAQPQAQAQQAQPQQNQTRPAQQQGMNQQQMDAAQRQMQAAFGIAPPRTNSGSGYVQYAGNPDSRITSTPTNSNMGYGVYGPPSPLAPQRYTQNFGYDNNSGY